MIHFLIEKETQTDDNEKNGTTQIIAMAKTRNNTKILQIFKICSGVSWACYWDFVKLLGIQIRSLPLVCNTFEIVYCGKVQKIFRKQTSPEHIRKSTSTKYNEWYHYKLHY